MPDISKILESTTGRYSRLYADNVQEMYMAQILGNRQAFNDASDRLGEVIRETLGVAELLGAAQTLQLAAKVIPQEARFSACVGKTLASRLQWGEDAQLLAFADTPTQTLLPRVTFSEAMQNILDRTPHTILDAAERTFRNIAKLYGENSQGVARIAFVRSAEESVTTAAQNTIARAIEKGIPEADVIVGGVVEKGAGKLLVESVETARKVSGPWSESYAKMAFRTNLNTATSAGQFRQSQDPAIKEVLPAFQFDAIGDVDTRPNHDAGDGLIFDSGHRVWLTHSSPLGYG